MSDRFFQALEDRRLFAVSFDATTGIINVTGTSGGNNIKVDMSGSNIRVTGAGAVYTRAISQVNGIFVDALGGNDKVDFVDIHRNATIKGGSGADTLDGSWGDDSIPGGSGADMIIGRDGNDVLKGDGGADIITAGDGHDRIYAGAGNDADALFGENGNDTLVALGGGDNDVCTGGAGTDAFWVDWKFLGTEALDASSSELGSGLVHDIMGFRELRRTNASGSVTTQSVSKELSGQSLIDPLLPSDVDATYQSFASKEMFSGRNPVLSDIDQGQIGDCYFLSALGAITKKSMTFMRRHSVDLGDGTYAIRYKGLLGMNEYVRVDADLPADENGNLVLARPGDDGAIWAAIYEKAWAFCRNNVGTYDDIDHGSPTSAFNWLGFSNEYSTPSGTAAQRLAKLQADLAAGKQVVLCTPDEGIPDNNPIIGDHCYTVDSIVTVNGVSMVKVYNPHGRDNAANDLDDSNPDDGFLTLTAAQYRDAFSGYVAI